MATGHLALLALLLVASIYGSQASIASHASYAPGLREAAAKRGTDLARAPDGSIATDAPLPTVHAHTGVRGAGDNTVADASAASDAAAAAAAAAIATPSVSLWLLLAMTMVMALLSGVGALPYLFTGKLDPYWSGIANAVGCGVMLAASFDLLEESKTYSASLVLGGILVGVLAMAYSQSFLARFEDVSFSDLQGADARKAMLIVGVMAAHAFGEGSGVGVSFSGPRGWAQGLLVTIAIGLHNIPEGMAVATIMVARGTPPRTALFWTLLSALPQGIVAVPAYMFVETFSSLLPIALGFAAGCMIWIVFAELIPDALETAEKSHVATAATLSAAALQCISMGIAKLERSDGTIASPVAADLSVLLPDLLILLPGFLAPCAAAGLAGSLLPSLPLSMGVAVGVGTWTGLAGLVMTLLHHSLDKHTAVLCAAAGAATCAALWGALATVAGPAPEHAARKDSGGGGVCVDIAKAEAGGVAELPHRQQYLEPQAGGGGAGGGGFMGNGNGNGGAHVNGVAAGVTTVHATGLVAVRSAGGGQGGGGLERRNGYAAGAHMHVVAGDGVAAGQDGGGGWAGQQRQGGLHCQGNCSCKECDAKPESWGVPMDLLPAVDRPRDCVRAALLLGTMMTMCAVPAAYDVAAVLLRHLGDTSTLLPPLVLRGLALGAAFVGVARAVAGAPGWRLPATAAGLLAATSAVTVAALLLPLPCGLVPTEEIVFDTALVAERLRAFASGGVLLAAVGYMWPAAAHFKPRKVQLGVSIGLGLAAAVALLNAGMCAGTPYCLAPPAH